MKTRSLAIIFAVAMLVGSAALGASAQNSQGLRVKVPFAFTANNKTLPAGTYRIAAVSDGSALWTIGSSNGGTAELLLANSLGGSARGDRYVTFHRYDDKYFLAGFKTPSYEISLSVSHGEKRLRMAATMRVPAEIITVETTAAGSR